MKNAIAAATKTKSALAAKLDWWEAGYFTKGSKERMRREAKRTLHRAIRRSERAHIAEQE
jgi:hypothetical protein